MKPPDHVVWGADWPHTRHEAIVDYDRAAAVKALYGLSLANEPFRKLPLSKRRARL